MNFLSKYKLLVFLLIISNIGYANESILLCLSGRIVKSLPSYGESFINGANLALLKNNLKNNIRIKTYFFDNTPLAPIRAYEKMRQDGCSAIIGFEYLTDLLLVAKIQKKPKIPIFSSYASLLSKEKLPKNIFLFMPAYDFLANKMMNFIVKKSSMKNILIVTEINRIEMQKYKIAYVGLLNRKKLPKDEFDFLDNDINSMLNLTKFIKNKHYDIIFLLTGTTASSKIANLLKNKKTIFIGTENFGSTSNKSFFIRLNSKEIQSYFVRNLDFIKKEKGLNSFSQAYEKNYNATPTVLSLYTYDATNLIINSFIKYHKVSVNNILHTKFIGLSGATVRNGIFLSSPKYVILSVNKIGYKYEE